MYRLKCIIAQLWLCYDCLTLLNAPRFHNHERQYHNYYGKVYVISAASVPWPIAGEPDENMGNWTIK